MIMIFSILLSKKIMLKVIMRIYKIKSLKELDKYLKTIQKINYIIINKNQLILRKDSFILKKKNKI